MRTHGSNCRNVIIGSSDGLPRNRLQAITWTKDDQVYWRKKMSLGVTWQCTNEDMVAIVDLGSDLVRTWARSAPMLTYFQLDIYLAKYIAVKFRRILKF